MGGHVFLCYAREDAAFVLTLAAKVMRGGLWINDSSIVRLTNRYRYTPDLRNDYYCLSMMVRGGGGGVIPGEHRATRHPGGLTTGKGFMLLDASLRWHDEIEPIRIKEMDHYVKEQMGHHSIKITVDTYGHLMPGGNKAAVDRLETTTIRKPDATAKGNLALRQTGSL
jgi:hypothetical protein